MWTIFKVFIEFVTLLLLFFSFGFLATREAGVLAPQPGFSPVALCIRRRRLNHWTTREVSNPLSV